MLLIGHPGSLSGPPACMSLLITYCAFSNVLPALLSLGFSAVPTTELFLSTHSTYRSGKTFCHLKVPSG